MDTNIVSGTDQKKVRIKVDVNRVVGIQYTLRGRAGNTLDSNIGFAPLEYLHGAGNIIPALEKSLAGLCAGDRITVKIVPEDGYGLRNEALVFTMPESGIEDAEPVEKGMSLLMESDDGSEMQVLVTDKRDGLLYLDANHPLAGTILDYDVEIVSIRDARPEEIKLGAALPEGNSCGSDCSCHG